MFPNNRKYLGSTSPICLLQAGDCYMNQQTIKISSHAERRMRQRAISRALVRLVWECGKIEHSHGDIICHLHDKKARQKAMRCLSEAGLAMDDHWRNAYIVVTGDRMQVITAGWRDKRVKRGYRPRRQKRNKGMRR